MGWDGTQVAAKRNFCEHHSKAIGELCSFPKEQRFARASVYLSVTPGGQQGMWRRLPPAGRICRAVNAAWPQLAQAGSGSSGGQSEGSRIGKERGGKTQPVLKGKFRFREDNS